MTTLHRLTAFEEYMLVDETVDHPMTFFLRLDLIGQVDVVAMRAAFSEVVARHPLLWSTVVRRYGRLYWRMLPERAPTLDVRLTSSLAGCSLKTHMDLAREPGIRAQLNLIGKTAALWLQFHHSCNDGIGGVRLVHELMDAYRLLQSGENSRVSSPEQKSFPTRRCAFQNLTRIAKTKRLAYDFARIWNFLRRPLVACRDHDLDEVLPSATPSFMEARLPFTRSMMARLKHTRPRPLTPTVNDVLLRDVYLALGDWIKGLPSSRGGQDRWIRISAATNMRNPSAEEIRCQNDVSLVFLDRRSRDLHDETQLLRGISAEMSQIKSDQMGCAMLRSLNWCRALPGGIAVASKLRRDYATAVVSNLGHVFSPQHEIGRTSMGNLSVATLGFLVPIRRGTPFSFGVLTHANELTIGMQYDDGLIPYDRAQQLLSYVTTRLSSSLGIEPQQDVGRAA